MGALGAKLLTKHKTQSERIDEILRAAAEVIDQDGYSNLTMDAVAGRARLSKGALYRFFGNKREIALALWVDSVSRWIDFDESQALSWGLSLRETLTRLLLDYIRPAAAVMRDRRIWLSLLAETLRDPKFLAEKRRLRRRGKKRFQSLIDKLIRRDGLKNPRRLSMALGRALNMGAVFMEGFMLGILTGESRSELERHARNFVEAMVKDAISKVEHATI